MKKLLVFICAIWIVAPAVSQTSPPFRKDIDAFKKKDSVQMPMAHSILFVGSSSFTKWTDVQDYFPGYPILNRGFGGSTLLDVIRYVDAIIIPYHPKEIIIYCGENDIASSDTVTAKTVLKRFEQLLSLIRKQLPKIPIAFISIKPSPSRWKLEPIMLQANLLIKTFLKAQAYAAYINVHDAMLNSDGSVMTDIFLADKLHMNAKGYKIWQPIILPYLKK